MRYALKIIILLVFTMLGQACAELVSERWGGAGTPCTHPGTLKVVQGQSATCLQFDLSAVPANTTIHHASLSYSSAGRTQPREPVQVFMAEKGGGKPAAGGPPLQLEAPWFRSLDATETVRQWVKNPEKNAGFHVAVFDCLNAREAFLDIRYEGTPKKVPAQITGLRAVHCNGQTFLTWKEIPEFQPAAEQIVWIDKFEGITPKSTVKEPGKDAKGNPFIPAIACKTLRELQGVAVRTELGKGQAMPPTRRVKEIPNVSYRVYRSAQKITAENLSQAEFCGEAEPFNSYMDLQAYWILCRGEYYDQHENPDALIPTFCVGNKQPVLPGEANYVHTPRQNGPCHYAVTTTENGTENAAQIGAGNSLAAPVEEKVETPQPVFQMASASHYNKSSTECWYLFWLAPPTINFPRNTPTRIGVSLPDKMDGPTPIEIRSGPSYGWFFGISIVPPRMIELLIGQDAGDLCYLDGVGSLRALKDSKIGYFSEHYLKTIIDWAYKNWQVDRSHVMSSLSTHFMIRHPDVSHIMYTEPFATDFDQKWNPAAGSLPARLGPRELTLEPDGSCAWDIFDISHYLLTNPGRETPFVAVVYNQPKDGNHGAEYGWQDDPKGMAALNKARQPYCAQWGGASFSGELRKFLANLKWDKSVPAFSRCTLDNSPGNGDPDEGEPWGQINGCLVWQYDDIKDAAESWEMTVALTQDAPRNACQVDITPRQCVAFKPAAGQKYKWTNTDLKGNQQLASGEITADQWGLITIEQTSVTKGKNRITIKKM